jgi:thiamine-phosphate pyrophosphorylase
VGDVASLIAAPEQLASLLDTGRRHGVALLTTDPESAMRLGADGVEVASLSAYDAARTRLGDRHIVGAACGSSRHLAMELADRGADYVAFTQSGDRETEPIIRWWSELFEVPCIAADPVEPGEVEALLALEPDFIRPSDRMWHSPEETRSVVTALMDAIARRSG